MSEATIVLKKGEGRTIKAGGAWVFDNEIDCVMGSYDNGDVVLVHDFDGYIMGRGFINNNSKIRVRMLTRKPDQVIDEAFIAMRVKNAWEYRKTVMGQDNLNCARIIFGEADWLPGLVVDKYADVLVVECLALGMEQFKKAVITSLVQLLAKDGFDINLVYERSDARERDKEGLPRFKGTIYTKAEGYIGESASNDYGHEADANVPVVEIIENGVHYEVDVVSGQKTGFFLDQKFNRLAMQSIVKGAINCEDNLSGAGTLKVLDCFTHMGTFALNCGYAGATDVTGLDISEFAVAQATANAKRNGLENSVKFRAANVLDELPKLNEVGEKYDIVILDPPAFTKSREATKNAIKGYRQINIQGLKLVRDGGYFATCSCSHFMTQELFVQTIAQAAKAAHKRLRQIEIRTQAADHPILWAADESYYLKFLTFQVVDEK